MNGVRAKFKCVEITHTVNGASALLEPVTGGSKENESFYKYTPSGKLLLCTINPAVAAGFAPGKEYYIDITPAE